MPIYVVTAKVKDAQDKRLVDAPNMSAALRHVSGQLVQIEKCSTAEAVTLGASGLKIERVEQ